MAYPDAADVFADANARIALAKALAERFAPVAGTPAERYAVGTRQLPAAAIGSCADLRYLAPPIDGRPPQDHALVSLLRDASGAVSGFQCEFCDIAGARTGTEPAKQAYALREHGVRDGLFHAGGSGDTAYVTEGYSCKALAVASLGLGPVYGGGGLTVLGFAVPPERTVVIVPDRAPPADQWTKDGKERLLDLHEAAYARAIDRLILAKRTPLIAAAPDCACCKDADRFLRKHGGIRLQDLLGRTTPGELSRDGEVKRLAAIAGDLDRAAAIKVAWKERPTLHGIPIGMLREHVDAERAKAHPAAAPKSTTVEPWDEPVELGAVLNELVVEIRRYIATPRTNLYASSLWSAMTHVYDRLFCAPKLALQSPTPQCGKTTLLDCLSNVVCRPEAVSGVAPGAFVRTSDAEKPTWLLDEADRYLNPRTAGEALTAAINAASYRRFARMRISVPRPDGGWDVQRFEFWCPMLLAGIKRLIDTVQDRSIVLRMQRARPGELKHRLVNGSSPVLRDVQRKLMRWAQDLEQLDLDPVVPRFLHNREADLWRPLFAIAAEAGGRWPARVQQAAWAIHGQRSEDTDRLGELLIAIRECFGDDDQLATTDLITRLINRSDEPWATIKRGQPLDAYYLRGMLTGIVKRTRPQQGGGRKVWRGYRKLDFAEAWARYIPPEPVSPSATSANALHTAGKPQEEPTSTVADAKSASDTVRYTADGIVTGGESSRSVADGPADLLQPQGVDLAAKIDRVADVAHVADRDTAPGVYIPDVTAGAAPEGTDQTIIALECSACGRAFEHDAHKRGRRPSRCPGCRGGDAAHDQAHQPEPQRVSADEAIDQVRAGLRCAYCGAKFRPGEQTVEINGRIYHDDDACAGTIRRRMEAE
jgi:hypothetical protein